MKQIYLFYALLWASVGLAQIPCPEDEAYSDFSFGVLKPLDKTQIPTGVLYENVFPLAAVDNFTGQSNADTSSTAHFLQAYAELYLLI